MSLYVILVAVAVLAVLVISSYNGFVRLNNMCDEAFATMDVYLKKRYDLIPNLVEVVKGYAAHESETMEKVIAARSAAIGAVNADRQAAEDGLGAALKGLLAIAEQYPDLKANTNFAELQEELSDVEDDIANARRYYNACIREFNTRCQAFPGVLFAGMFGFSERGMFLSSEEERENVKVSF